jgi:putative chitinase
MRLVELYTEPIEERKAVAALGAAMAMTMGNPTQAPFDRPPERSQPATAEQNLEILVNAARRAGITGIELAQLLAQAAHETANFTKMVEPESAARKNDITVNPDKARRLGNVEPGDGLKYKGRGHFHITTRATYEYLARKMNLPIDQYPELLYDPHTAADATIVFWKTQVQPRVRDWTDTARVTKIINGGYNGLNSRQALFKKYLSKVDPKQNI